MCVITTDPVPATCGIAARELVPVFQPKLSTDPVSCKIGDPIKLGTPRPPFPGKLGTPALN